MTQKSSSELATVALLADLDVGNTSYESFLQLDFVRKQWSHHWVATFDRCILASAIRSCDSERASLTTFPPGFEVFVDVDSVVPTVSVWPVWLLHGQGL